MARIEEIPNQNAGFDIIGKTLSAGGGAVVLGMRPGGKEFVTWSWNRCGGFYWGHYINDMAKAYSDFFKRSAQECATA